MLAEFIDKIAGLAKTANGVSIVQIPGDPRRVLVAQSGTSAERSIPAPLRKHQVHGLDDLVRLVGDETIASAPEVFHDDERVEVILERADRRESAVMSLVHSQRFLRLVELQIGIAADARDIVRFLRFELHDCGVAEVLKALRQVDFTRQSSGGRTTEHGRESLGRSVEAAVQQADKIPEEFTAEVPVFQNSGLRSITAKVRVGVYVDVDAEKVELRTLTDEIEQAKVQAQRSLGAELMDRLGEVPVFHGSAH